MTIVNCFHLHYFSPVYLSPGMTAHAQRIIHHYSSWTLLFMMYMSNVAIGIVVCFIQIVIVTLFHLQVVIIK